MELVKDLGTRPTSTGHKVRWGLYKCPECSLVSEKRSNSVGSICGICNSLHRAKAAYKAKHEIAKASFVSKALDKHGDAYEYSAVEYVHSKEKVSVYCNTCEVYFMQTPNNHLKGAGCPQCGFEKTDIAKRMHKDGPAILYYVYFEHINMWKLGVTEKSEVEARFKPSDRKHLEILMVKSYSNAGAAYRDEAKVLKELQDYRYDYLIYGKLLKSKGNSELFTEDVLDKVISVLVSR
jgi:hypothetical protein